MLKSGSLFAALAVLLAVAAISVSPAHATSTYSDRVAGIEYYATSTEGRFVGGATGGLPGIWQADVHHEALSGATPVSITGGSIDLATALAGSPTQVSGTIATGTITQTSGFNGCVDQTYDVDGTLSKVGPTGLQDGTGEFAITLTHYRARFFGLCVTYGASVQGSVSFDF